MKFMLTKQKANISTDFLLTYVIHSLVITLGDFPQGIAFGMSLGTTILLKIEYST